MYRHPMKSHRPYRPDRVFRLALQIRLLKELYLPVSSVNKSGFPPGMAAHFKLVQRFRFTLYAPLSCPREATSRSKNRHPVLNEHRAFFTSTKTSSVLGTQMFCMSRINFPLKNISNHRRRECRRQINGTVAVAAVDRNNLKDLTVADQEITTSTAGLPVLLAATDGSVHGR